MQDLSFSIEPGITSVEALSPNHWATRECPLVCIFLICLILLNIMFLRFTHVVVINCSFICISDSIVWTYSHLFIHFLVDGCFRVLITTNKVAMNLQVSCEYMFLFFLGIYLGMELLGHIGVSMFNLLRNWQTVLQSVPFYIKTVLRATWSGANIFSIWVWNWEQVFAVQVRNFCQRYLL